MPADPAIFIATPGRARLFQAIERRVICESYDKGLGDWRLVVECAVLVIGGFLATPCSQNNYLVVATVWPPGHCNRPANPTRTGAFGSIDTILSAMNPTRDIADLIAVAGVADDCLYSL